MSRRADPELIHEARRAATVERLVREGKPRERVEALVVQWEAMAASKGLALDRRYWEAFDVWLASDGR
jgi:hypothetical protein